MHNKRRKDSEINVFIGYGYHPITTATYLQRSFARRAETTFVGTPWGSQPGFAATSDIGALIAAAGATPDLYVYIDSGAAPYFPRGLAQLPCPTVCYLIDVHVQPAAHLRRAMFFDYAFSAQRDFVAALCAAGHPQAHWLPLACDPAIHHPYDAPKRYDVAFVGATGRGYERRRVLLERLARRFTANDYTRPYTPSEMAYVYSEARLVFNCSLRREVNMRVFEGPASGALLLTDRIDNGLSDLVTDGEHVALYDDATLLAQAEELLRDGARRERIARQGYEHVRAHHTYDHRVGTIMDTVFGAGTPRREAPLRKQTDAAVSLAYAEIYARMGRVDDTVDQCKRLPSDPRLRLRAATQIARAFVKHIRNG